MPETRQATEDDVVRARRIEVVDFSDRVRVAIGDLEGPGTHEITGFGIVLRGPNGSVRADLIEDAGGARLGFMSSGNQALELGAEDANPLMLDRGGDDLVYLPAGSPGNEVTAAGPFIIFSNAGGGPPSAGRSASTGRRSRFSRTPTITRPRPNQTSSPTTMPRRARTVSPADWPRRTWWRPGAFSWSSGTSTRRGRRCWTRRLVRAIPRRPGVDVGASGIGCRNRTTAGVGRPRRCWPRRAASSGQASRNGRRAEDTTAPGADHDDDDDDDDLRQGRDRILDCSTPERSGRIPTPATTGIHHRLLRTSPRSPGSRLPGR